MDIKDIKYEIKALLKDGRLIDITGAGLSVSRQEGAEEIAQRATLSLAQAEMDKGKYLNELLPLCTVIILYADGRETFRGKVWEVEYSSGSQKTINIICYDNFMYAQNSKDNSYYASGKSTKDIVGNICSTHGIKLNYTYGNIKHAKVLYKSIDISEQILRTLEDAQSKLKDKFVARYEKDTLYISKQGQNSDVYVFEAAKNVISASQRDSMDGLVTKVIVVGKEDSKGRQKIEATLKGKTEYGTLQEIVQRDSNNTIEKARDEAQKILDERGTPKKTISVETVDVPAVKKGDKVKIKAGNLNGCYYVKGVNHYEHNRTMTMELEKAKPETSTSNSGNTNASNKSGNFNVGDSVILNGTVYATSYGERAGRTFTNYKGKITIKADTSRLKPYHIDGIGWVSAADIRKA